MKNHNSQVQRKDQRPVQLRWTPNSSPPTGRSFLRNLVTEKWAKKANIPTARMAFSTSVVNGKIYAIGGSGGSSVVEEYDPVTNKWTKKADMPTPRVWLSTSVVNGKIYAIGGSDRNMTLSIVEEYDTGFVDLGIEMKGKLVTSWGKIKSKY